jgi:sucrose-phosphate synthase
MKQEEIERRYKISKRIDAEENTIFFADKIITSTKHEIENQYSQYSNFDAEKFLVIPPGCELDRFHPYDVKREWSEEEQVIRDNIRNELWRFFTTMFKPLILSLCRPDRKKNITGLIKAYGSDKELQEKANLAIFAGIRKDIQKMDEAEKEVLTEILLLMDKYNLYGKMAIPKTHDFQDEVPELYRTVAETQGVFVNSAFNENFGLTLIEAAASGLPVVTTENGGPKDILKNLDHGILVDVSNHKNISSAIKEILKKPDLWKKFSNNGIARVKKYYSWEAHVDSYLKIVKDLIKIRERTPKIFSQMRKRLLKLDKLIILDIDDTITGDEKSYKELNSILSEIKPNIGFGVATGRTIDSALQKLDEIGFRKPDLIISSVGSEIYYNDNDKYVYSTSWETHIKNAWKPDKIREIVNAFDFLESQGEEGQRKFKVSYNLEGEVSQINLVTSALKKHRIKTNVILSHGVYVDFLPFRASKGRAIRYLGYRWNIPFENILVGGDSGNDEDMLTGDLLGVVVGNHSKELKQLKGRRRIYFSKHKHAAGIIDGLKYYNFIE